MHSFDFHKAFERLRGNPPKEPFKQASEDGHLTSRLLLLAVLMIVAAIRVRMLASPLERDEGEYAYMGQLLSQGVPPYRLAANMKWPGTYFGYWAIMSVFGQSPAGIHLGLACISTLTSLGVFIFARRLAGETVAVVAAGTQAVLSIAPATLGLAAHATHFVILPAFGGILLLYGEQEHLASWRFFVAGLLFGVATLMKQAGVFFAIFGLVQILSQVHQQRRIVGTARPFVLYLLGCGLPLVFTLLYLVNAGVFARFWLWTVKYAAAYATIVSPRNGLIYLQDTGFHLFKSSPVIWGLAAAGLFAALIYPRLKAPKLIVFSFVGLSFLAVCPGWYFRGHYFLLFLPAVGVLVGLSTAWIGDRLSQLGAGPSLGRVISLLLFALFASSDLYSHREIYFQRTPDEVSRLIYGDNPFPESREIGEFLSRNCPQDGSLAVIGSEPQIYFYAKRRSATTYIYTYALMEPQPYAGEMQSEMIQEIESANPDYMVYVHVSTSWLVRAESIRTLFTWFDLYKEKNFDLIYLVQIIDGKGEYTPLPSVPAPRLQSDIWLTIYRNKRILGRAP